MKRPTQVDVARLAGVSRATVSYVVNNQTGGRVPISEETRQRVLEAVAELDCVPDAHAQALRSGNIKTIGLIIPDIHNPHFWEIADGVEQEANAAGLPVDPSLIVECGPTIEDSYQATRQLFELPSRPTVLLAINDFLVIAVLWRKLFEKDGLVNILLGAIGFTDLPGWITNPKYALWTLILLMVWQFGSSMIIFLAGLKQIPQEYYEAASVDGATKGRQFFAITIHCPRYSKRPGYLAAG